jgi:uncharacterized membrane protein
VVGALLAFVLEYLDDTLKTSEDVERFTGLTLIGSIPVAGNAASASPKSKGRFPAAMVSILTLIGGRR